MDVCCSIGLEMCSTNNAIDIYRMSIYHSTTKIVVFVDCGIYDHAIECNEFDGFGNAIGAVFTTRFVWTARERENVAHLFFLLLVVVVVGEITLRSCKAYDCSKQLVYLTASNETFNFRINYEKSIGTKCQSDLDCNHRHSFRDLLECDSLTQTCQCLNENITTIDLPHLGRFCTDSIAQSNCSRHPQRCLQWCDQSTTSHCICPTSTRKVRRINGIFDCELEPLGKCRFDDEQEIGMNIRKCPTGTMRKNSSIAKIDWFLILGTVCDGYQCQPVTVFRQIPDNTSDPSETSPSIFFSDPLIQPAPKTFIRILVIIILASLLFCVLIIFIIAMLIKARRFRWPSTSDDKTSSSSFIHSTSTALSNEIYQFKPQSILSYDYSQRHANHFYARPSSYYLPGLVPQTNLSPRFYRSVSGWNPHYRRAQIRSSSLTHTDQGLFPSIRHLQNGDVLISAWYDAISVFVIDIDNKILLVDTSQGHFFFRSVPFRVSREKEREWMKKNMKITHGVCMAMFG